MLLSGCGRSSRIAFRRARSTTSFRTSSLACTAGCQRHRFGRPDRYAGRRAARCHRRTGACRRVRARPLRADLVVALACPKAAIVYAGLLFSALTVLGWSSDMFGSKVKAIGFTALLEEAILDREPRELAVAHIVAGFPQRGLELLRAHGGRRRDGRRPATRRPAPARAPARAGNRHRSGPIGTQHDSPWQSPRCWSSAATTTTHPPRWRETTSRRRTDAGSRSPLREPGCRVLRRTQPGSHTRRATRFRSWTTGGSGRRSSAPRRSSSSSQCADIAAAAIADREILAD
jgi:hypothetical protein